MSATAAILVSGLAKRYGARAALAGVDLEVRTGEAFGLIGANGAGKTTLIRCLLDLAAPDAGRIELYGVAAGRPAARSRLAYLPERFVPPYFLRGREFFEMSLRLAGQPYDEARARAALAELELDADCLERPVRELSKGMTQKLGLAACFLAPRDLYLLDEPMSDLDPASRVAVKGVLSRLGREGRTVFLTSHVLADIEELCASIAVLERGQMRFRGAPAELRARFGAASLEQAFISCIRSGEAVEA